VDIARPKSQTYAVDDSENQILDYRSAYGLWQREQDGVHHAEPTELTSVLPAGYFRGLSEAAIEWQTDLPFLDWTAALRQSRYDAFNEDNNVPSQLFKRCKYCASPLRLVYDERQGQEWQDSDYRRVRVSVCQCGWWNAEDVYSATTYESRLGGYDWQCINSQGRLRLFDISDAHAPTESLREVLSSGRFATHQIDPYALERLVGDVLADFFDCEVRHVGRSGDGGIDLLVLDADQPRAVQVKRRSNNKAESVAFVREFLGAMVLAGHMEGIFVSTAPRFSPPAIEAAKSTRLRRYATRIDLLDANALTNLIRSTSPIAPWVSAAPTLSSPLPGAHAPQ
jgi:hypothetical protein